MQCINRWGVESKNITAIMVTGSLARKDNKADEYSDLDLILLTTGMDYYKSDFRWVSEIFPPLSCSNGVQVSDVYLVRRVYFENGVGVDFTFISNRMIKWASLYTTFLRKSGGLSNAFPGKLKASLEGFIYSYVEYIHRGYYFMLDKTGMQEVVCNIESTFAHKPLNRLRLIKVQNAINEFWQDAFRMAISLHRNELFTAKFGYDQAMKASLLVLITEYMRSVKGLEYETWHKGRFIEEWAEPFISEKLQQIYSRYDSADAWRGLLETTELFTEITRRLLTRLERSTLISPAPEMTRWIHDLRRATADSQ